MLKRSFVFSLFFFIWGVSAANASDIQSKDESLFVEWRGEFKQGALLIGKLIRDDVVSVAKGDRSLIINKGRNFGLGLGRDHGSKFELVFELKNGQKMTKAYGVQKRDYKIQKVTGVPQRTVTPDPAHLKRIRAESAKVKNAKKQSDNQDYYMESFIWPAKGLISGVYGSQRYYNGEPRRPHYGLDIAAPEGTDVIAPVSGKVVLAEKDLFFSGGTVILDHGHGISSSFLHMSKLNVEVGQLIKQGDKIGEIGSTGRATGAHLDWRMSWFDQRVDPRMLMKESVPPKK